MSRLFKSHVDNGQKANTKRIEIKKIQPRIDDIDQLVDNQDMKKETDRLLEEAENSAATLIMEARQQANDLLEDMKQQKEQWIAEKQRLTEEAYDEGFQVGLNDGKKQGFEAYSMEIERAKQITDQSKIEYQRYIDSSEKVILELGIAAAERVIRNTFEGDPERFLPLVKMALKEVRDSKEIQIHVHPAQYELLISEKEALLAIFPKDVDCFIYPDIDLEEYSCQIESENGRIDANITSQLLELKEKLVEMLAGEKHEG